MIQTSFGCVHQMWGEVATSWAALDTGSCQAMCSPARPQQQQRRSLFSVESEEGLQQPRCLLLARRAGPGRAELPRTPAQSWAAILANHGARQPREISINVPLVSLEPGWAAAPPLGLVTNGLRVSPRALWRGFRPPEVVVKEVFLWPWPLLLWLLHPVIGSDLSTVQWHWPLLLLSCNYRKWSANVSINA